LHFDYPDAHLLAVKSSSGLTLMRDTKLAPVEHLESDENDDAMVHALVVE
jgi:hypothetical protein